MSAGASVEESEEAYILAKSGFAAYHKSSVYTVAQVTREHALAIDALVQRAVERERERCCRAVCKHCAEGNEPRPARDYDQPMHLFQGYPPRVCSAAALRATSNTGG